ncbi:MAG: ABC transporter ATP-binding protein, partial [Oscillospiraceae bacterium]|nr:ABC transporter ATP-binding protein [Oscillospiraceae bacterium]
MKNKEISNYILKDFHKNNRILELSVNTLIFLVSFFEISISWVIQKAINSVSEDKSFDELLSSVIWAALVLVLINLINYIMQRLQNVYLKKFNIYLKEKMFSELMNKSIVEFDALSSG